MATDLYPTPTRVDLLRDVAAGEVWQKSNGHTTVPASTDGPYDNPLQVVTVKVREMERAGWVVLVERDFGSRQWQLTDTGRAVLDAHPEEITR